MASSEGGPAFPLPLPARVVEDTQTKNVRREDEIWNNPAQKNGKEVAWEGLPLVDRREHKASATQ